ncbi:MAG: carboxypeptidase regulatory-like domain-containing protein, partial [bacterium]|nr:carboxypeptidase regulatory-like domain-containing protein [bacterium]
MTRRTRKILFWLSSIAFVVVALSTLAYSFGYRISTSGDLLQTGGLFIAAVPGVDVDILVNDELIKTTSLLSRSAFIQSLRPGEYDIEVRREGFHEWKKRVDVQPELVTEVRAILINDPPQVEILAKGDFVSMSEWNDGALKISGVSPTDRFFDVENNVFILKQDAGASSTPGKLPEEVAEHLETILPDGFILDNSNDRIAWWDGKSAWIEWLPKTALPFYGEERVKRVLKSDHPIRDIKFYPR